jgi:hypothetical protein
MKDMVLHLNYSQVTAVIWRKLLNTNQLIFTYTLFTSYNKRLIKFITIVHTLINYLKSLWIYIEKSFLHRIKTVCKFILRLGCNA